MNYLSCIDAAKKLGVSTRRIQQMCKQGEISNAIKDGRTWLIPDDITLKQLNLYQSVFQISNQQQQIIITLIKL